MPLFIFLEMKTAQHGVGELYQRLERKLSSKGSGSRGLANSSRQTAGWY